MRLEFNSFSSQRTQGSGELRGAAFGVLFRFCC